VDGGPHRALLETTGNGGGALGDGSMIGRSGGPTWRRGDLEMVATDVLSVGEKMISDTLIAWPPAVATPGNSGGAQRQRAPAQNGSGFG
jgi:hypothetical protein